MTQQEKAALDHAKAWLQYQRSPQARRDLEADRARRAAADRKAGHSPQCSLTRCSVNCPGRTEGRFHSLFRTGSGPLIGTPEGAFA